MICRFKAIAVEKRVNRIDEQKRANVQEKAELHGVEAAYGTCTCMRLGGTMTSYV